MEFLFVIALLPVVLLLSYIYKKDVDKEPRALLTKLFIFGGLSVIPVAIMEIAIGNACPTNNLPTFTGTFLAVFVVIALVEEIGKWLFLYICTYRRREYNHAYDGIVYAVFVSLGFAAVENVLYVVQSGVATGLFRAVTAVPGHAVDAVFMGYFYSKSKQELVNKNNSKSLMYLLLSVLVPAITHTIYDTIIIHYTSVLDIIYILYFFAFVIASYILAVALVKKYAKLSTNFDGSPCVDTAFNKKPYVVNNNTVAYTPAPTPIVRHSYCPMCGGIVENNKCTVCGFVTKQ